MYRHVLDTALDWVLGSGLLIYLILALAQPGGFCHGL
jgi:hypothetical protein